jgi:hypothetical protein
VTIPSYDLPARIQWRRTFIRLFVLLIVLAFLAPRLLLLAFASGFPISDGKWYFDRAISIALGQGYTFNGKVTAFWPIGYPGFLSLLFLGFPRSPLTGLVANFFLSAATVVCSFYIFRYLRVGYYWCLFGCLILSAYPTFILYQQMLLSEILTAMLIAAAILTLLNSRSNIHYLFSGIIFGLTVLVKSQVILFVVFVPLYDMLVNRAIRHLVKKYFFLWLGLAITVLPWTLRNIVDFDRFIIIQSNGGYNLFAGNNSMNRYGGSINADELATIYPEVVSDITKPLPDEIGMNDRASAAALKFIDENPIEVLRRVPHKLFRFFNHDALPFEWIPRSNARVGRQLPWLLSLFEISFWYHTTVMILAILSGIFFLADPLRTRAHYFLLCVIFSFAFVSMIFFGSGRFAVPVLPAFVGCALVTLCNLEIRFFRPLVRLIIRTPNRTAGRSAGR